MRTLFLALWAIMLACPSAQSIEIFVKGRKYQSLEAYQASQKPPQSKTDQVKPQEITDAVQHKLYVLSVENGLVNALEAFYQGHGHAKVPLSDLQLQEAIKQAVTQSPGSKILIAGPGKVRVMSLEGR